MNDPALTSDLILRKQVANILKKANSGKILNAREEKILSDYQTPETKTFVKNKVDLAKRLGVNRRTIHEWSKFKDFPKPRSNGEWCLEEVSDWKEEKGFKGGEAPKLLQLREEALVISNEMDRFELEREKGLWIKVEDAEREIGQMVARAKTVLRGKFENELPYVCAGFTAAQIQIENRKAIDEVCLQLSR